MKKRQQLFMSIMDRASEDDAFRAAILADAKSAISEEFHVQIPDGINLVVHENDSTTMHLPLPARPEVLSEGELRRVSGGDSETCSACI